ncbi:ABC-2 family transporter protein, partial [Halomonas sp. THAF12]|uniref:ABC-2 family transporter protein n=1 Tax=Halomonas sp. B23F22_10 TaxID=3459515 RepID=UPI00373E4C80
MKRYIELYLFFIKKYIKALSEYRADLIMGIFSSIILQLTGLLMIWVIFENINDIKGWSYYEVIFVYGILTTSRSINEMFFESLWGFGTEYIQPGKFDIILIRPISPLFHLISNKFQFNGIGSFVLGVT